MAFYDTTRPAGFGRVRRLIAEIVHDFADWREERETRKALSKLTDGELFDIGLQRSDLHMRRDELRNG